MMKPMITTRYLAVLVVSSVLMMAARAGGAGVAGRVGGVEGGENPALTHLNEQIVFYLSFDHGLTADMAVGEPGPAKVEGALTLMPGRYGQAVLVGKDGLHRADYPSWRNIDFASPGAMSFWLSPHNWRQRDEHDARPYLRLFDHRGAQRGSVFVQRQGFSYITREDGSLSRRHDRIQVGYYHFPGIDNAIFSQAGSDRWTNGQWHLLVVNWDRSGFAVSLDGQPPRRVALSQPLSGDDFPAHDAGLTMTLGSGASAEHTLLDEFVVYRRPLSSAEIQQLYLKSAPLPAE